MQISSGSDLCRPRDSILMVTSSIKSFIFTLLEEVQKNEYGRGGVGHVSGTLKARTQKATDLSTKFFGNRIR